MCLLVVAHRVSADYPLLVAANRDEFLARPTAALHVWSDPPGIVAGRDLQAGGTWLGACAGRWAALTNVRRAPAPVLNGPSRGHLVVKALTADGPLSGVAATLQGEAHLYRGFNLLLGDGKDLCYVSSEVADWRLLAPGCYPLSNGTLDSTWPKMWSAHERMHAFAQQPGTAVELSALLTSSLKANRGSLPATGVSTELEQALSSEFIVLPDYGTRCATGLMVSASGSLTVAEQSYAPGGLPAGMKTRTVPTFW